MSESINKKAVSGVSWSMIDTLTNYFIHFFIGIVLARLLSPSDYGLIGMITVFITISDTFVNAGFGQAFIHKKDATNLDASTIFVINLVLGVLLYAIFWICAPLISKFYNEPILVDLIRVLFLIIIINALTVIQYSKLRKELLFKKKAVISIASSVLSGTAGIIAAYDGLGVWSLVIQSISSKFILCVLYYCTSNWRLSLRFSFASAKELFSYGSWLMISNTIATIFNQFYTMSIGKLFASSQLGYYNRANQFKNVFADSFTWVFGTVSFPIFSQMQNDAEKLKKITANFVAYSSLLVFPLMSLLYVLAEPFIVFLITDKWLGCVSYVQAFCLVGVLAPLYSFLGPILQGTGNVKSDLIFTLSVCIARIVNVIALHRFGILFIIYGEAAIQLLSIIITSVFVKKSIGFNYLNCVVDLKWIAMASLTSIFVGLFLFSKIDSSPFITLVVISIPMIISYLLVIYFFQKDLLFQSIKLLVKKNDK